MMHIISQRILWTTIALVLAAGLVYAGYRLGGEQSARDPDLVILESLTNPRPNPATAALLLKELIIRDTSLRTDELTEWEMTNRIRDWAYANIAWSTQSYLLDRNPSFDFYSRSAPEIFAAFLSDGGGVWCGGAAHALMKLYRLFGFPASTLQYGRSDVMDHVVTLVRITYRGRQKTVIQDPTFNLTYTTASGVPYDYFDLLSALNRGDHAGVIIFAGNDRTRKLLVHPREGRVPVSDVLGPAQVLKGGKKKYKFLPSLETFERQYGPAIYAFLRNEGRPADIRYLLLYPMGGSDRSLVEKAQHLSRRK